MARVVGIPSRVAVGFLPGEQVGDTWEVSIRDMHAWPELYFAGYGWVRFEPTPAQVTGRRPRGPCPERDSGRGLRPSAVGEPTEAGAGPGGPVGGPPPPTDDGRSPDWVAASLTLLVVARSDCWCC